MSRKPNSIKEINDSKETWKLAVRIVNIWTVNRSPKPTLEMIFMNKEGDKIVAQVKNLDLDTWDGKLKEGSCYVVENFEVETNRGQYKASGHTFKLNFGIVTRVKEQDLPEIPTNVYKLTPLDDILNGTAATDYLIDVIGEFSEIVQWDLDSKLKKVVLVLKDQGGSTVQCTLWEAFALQLKSFMDKHETGPVVMLLHLAKIKEPKGNYPLSIQNSMYGSKLLINDNVPEIENYRNSLEQSQSSVICFSDKMTQQSYSSQLSPLDKFCYNAEMMSVGDLAEVKKECFSVTVATINKVLVAHGWTYEGCPNCNKKSKNVGLPYICSECGKESSKAIPRFRVQVSVGSGKQTANFTLWDRECAQLLKKTAAEIIEQIIAEDGEFHPWSIPAAIDDVLDKTVAFRVKAYPNNKNFSVYQISEDEAIISSIIKNIRMEQALDNTPNDKPSSSNIKMEDFLDSQTLSATADYDPNQLESLTPAKRLTTTDSHLEDIDVEDLGSFQQSSSKLTKHIKTE